MNLDSVSQQTCQLWQAAVSTSILITFGKQHQHTFKNMHIQLLFFFHFHILYLLLNSCDGNDTFWCRSMLAKQSNSFSRKYRILSLQICVRQTVRLTRKPGLLQYLATDAGMRVHCTRHMTATPATYTAHQWHLGSISQNVEAVGQWSKRLRACVKAKWHHFEYLLNWNRLFSEPPTVYRGKHVVSCPFCCSYLKANKTSKSEGTRKVEYPYHFWKYTDAVTQNYQN